VKVGIVGAGEVGAACLHSLALRGSAAEVVLVNRTPERARGNVVDLQYGALLGPPVRLSAGGYDDLAGCGVVAVTVGLNEREGGATDRHDPAGRLRLLAKNAAIYRDVVPRIVKAAPDAILLVVTDPPDPLADVAREAAGHDRVLSSGTFLDSLRLRWHLGRRLNVDPRSVEALVLGEHGTSQVYVWSSARVGATPIVPSLIPKAATAAQFRAAVEEDVKFANIDIIEGTGASRLGIGVVVARIVEMIARDERAVIPIGSWQERYGVTLSLPSVVGRMGVERVLEPALSPEEERALEASAGALREARRSARP
jgi:L-lactate dehydrogenase